MRDTRTVNCQHKADTGCYWCCQHCDYDLHRCGGCGEPLKHGQYTCKDCSERLEREKVTPLKKIIWDGFAIYTQDHADIITLVAVGANERQAEWLVGCLEAYHKVPVEKVEIGSVRARAF